MKKVTLEKILINGFKDPNKQAEIKFSSNTINVVYGHNGAGKTTLFDLIYAIFDKNEKKLLAENVHSIYIKYKIEDSVKEVKIHRNIRKNYENYYNSINKYMQVQERAFYDWSYLEKSELNNFKVLYITPHRGLKNYRHEFTVDKLTDYFNDNDISQISLSLPYKDLKKFIDYVNGDNYKNVEKWIKSRKNIYIDGINAVDIEKLICEYNTSIHNTVIKQLQAELKITNIIIKILERFSLKYDMKNSDDNLYMMKKFTSKERELIYKMQPSVIELLDCLEEEKIDRSRLELIEELKKQIMKYNRLLSVNDNERVFEVFKSMTHKNIRIVKNEVRVICKDKEHTVKELSHGERHILTLFTLLKYVGDRKNLILIDEPDIALDTDWQERLLTKFKELTNKQMLVASHSPYIAIEDFKSQIELIGGLE